MRLKLDNESGLREAQAALFKIIASGGGWLLLIPAVIVRTLMLC
jgi:hypothetical protein